MGTRDDHGLSVTVNALTRQIAALPCSLYEVRLIHRDSRKPYPGVRRWTASRLLNPATVRFLRIRNREGYDVYFRPYAGDHNAGYILLDLDDPDAGIIASLRAHGHEPSVVVETSPGRLQAWIRVSVEPLRPALATRVSRILAPLYSADLASADWRHVARLVGFTNRKPQRCGDGGLSPWVKLIYARACLARNGMALIDRAAADLASSVPARGQRPLIRSSAVAATDGTSLRAAYQHCLSRLRILERYPSPDWSIADKWIARALLQVGTPVPIIAEVLRNGSPDFPRRHGNPDDYIHRTIECAARQLHSVFPAQIVPPA